MTGRFTALLLRYRLNMSPRSSAPTYLLVALTALLPRVIGLGQFVTIDEAGGWMPRSQHFLAALSGGDLAATAQSAHPGVTTMWLGATGLLLHGLLAARGMIDPADFATRLGLMQMPLALVNAAAVVAGLWLLRRLLAPQVALLATMLWALDPFVIGFSRVLHVDALMGSFATLSLLAACVFWLRGETILPTPSSRGERLGERGHIVVLLSSGILAALAVLSKSPGVILAPAVAGVAAWATWRNRRPWRQSLRELALWGAAAALTALLIWPALWFSPALAVSKLTESVTVEGGEPHQSGNFYLGQPVDVPGPTYYATALAMRLTPLTLAGLGLLALRWRRRPPAEQAVLAALAWLILLIALELSLFPKKFDRYLEPAFPAIDILAAAGVWAVAEGWRSSQRAGFLAWVTLAAAANAAWWHPYGLVAYNQLLGGATAGARTFHMGWGEGMPQVADWLAHQPGIAEQATVSSTVATLRPYLRPGVGVDLPPVSGQLPPHTGFAVVYLRSAQAGLTPPLDQIAATQRAVYTLTIQGVVYAQIYELTPTPAHPLSATFGPAISLQGYDLAEGANTLDLTLHWQTADKPPGVSLFVHLLDPQGERRAQIDLPAITAGWDAGRHYRTRVSLPLPGGLPADNYQIVIGLYDPQNFVRLPLSGASPANPAFAGPDALLLAAVSR